MRIGPRYFYTSFFISLWDNKGPITLDLKFHIYSKIPSSKTRHLSPKKISKKNHGATPRPLSLQSTLPLHTQLGATCLPAVILDIHNRAHSHPLCKCTRILPLTHNAPESYPSHINAPKSSILQWIHRIRTSQTWMHRNHNPSSKCNGILPLTHECTEIVDPQVKAPKSYP